jgi:hypothetical protein
MRRVCKLNIGVMRTGRKPPRKNVTGSPERNIEPPSEEMDIVDNILELEDQ